MEIRCHSCGKIYTIDESKIPSKGKVYVKCASCQEKIEVCRKNGEEHKNNNSPLGSESPEPPVEYFDPDTKTALIYCQDIQARLEMEKKLANLGFETRGIKDEADIRHYFRYHIFDIVILYQHGPDPDDDLQTILDYLNQMPSHVRRRTLILYIHLSGNRHDLYDAFLRGVDSTISPMDISDFQELIPKLMENKTQNYKVFYDCLSRVEESII